MKVDVRCRFPSKGSDKPTLVHMAKRSSSVVLKELTQGKAFIVHLCLNSLCSSLPRVYDVAFENGITPPEIACRLGMIQEIIKTYGKLLKIESS